MAEQITNYQCPSCNGPLKFNGTSHKLQCEYCSSAYEVQEIESLYADKEQQAKENFEAIEEKKAKSENWDLSNLSGDWGQDADNMKAYNCPSCSAELICDATTAATSCPYCGNPTVVPGQFGGTLKPDYIIPFNLDKEASKQALKNHYKGKIFLPSAFTKGNHIEEIKGIYVPFWFFDADADAHCSFNGTKSFTRREGEYDVTTTHHFEVIREGTLSFEQIPADASSKMPDDYMDSIEPYDYSQLKPFSTAYLPGYLADKYDVTAEESAPRADLRCKNSAINVMKNDIRGYNTLTEKYSDVQLTRGAVHYALLPVWTLATSWNGKTYLFAMNGQTGKIVGDLPVSQGKFWGMWAGGTVALGTIFSLLGIGSWIASMFLY